MTSSFAAGRLMTIRAIATIRRALPWVFAAALLLTSAVSLARPLAAQDTAVYPGGRPAAWAVRWRAGLAFALPLTKPRMNKINTHPTAAPGLSGAPQMRQLSLGLFPTAPGRVPAAAPPQMTAQMTAQIAPQARAPQFLRQAVRAGDSQRSLQMRATATDKR